MKDRIREEIDRVLSSAEWMREEEYEAAVNAIVDLVLRHRKEVADAVEAEAIQPKEKKPPFPTTIGRIVRAVKLDLIAAARRAAEGGG